MIELQIDNLAIGGRGIGRLNGKAVFVPYTLPGEKVRCRLVREKKSYCEAELLEVVDRSPDRIEPQCPVFAECGGCQWQHVPYGDQLVWKQRLFQEAITRAHPLDSDLFKPIVASPEAWNYRCRAQVKCRLTENGFVAGFYRPGSHYVVDIDACPLLAAPLNQLLAKIKPLFSRFHQAHRVPQLDLSVDAGGHLQLIVHFLERDHASLTALLSPVADEMNCSVYVQKGRKNSIIQLVTDGQPFIEPLPGMTLQYPPGSFTQVNLQQNRKLVADVLSFVPDGSQVIDLYCGIGNFSLPLAQKVAHVSGIEDYAPAIAAAMANAERLEIENTTFIAADAAAGLAKVWRDDCGVVILDPPRSGAFDVVKRLADLKPNRIIYVSCDPMTLSRDLNILLHNGYRALHLRAYDMFPQTGHIEGLVVLDRDAVQVLR